MKGKRLPRGSHLKRSVASPGFLYAAVCLIIGNEGSRAFVAPRLGSATGRDESFWGMRFFTMHHSPIAQLVRAPH